MKQVMGVKLGNMVLGQGPGRICVPFFGSSDGEIMDSLDEALRSPADLFEFRCDYYSSAKDTESLSNLLKKIREKTGERALIFTLRSKEEGGLMSFSDDEYYAVCKAAIQSGCTDMIDMELFRLLSMSQDGSGNGPVEMAHCAGLKVIISNHDFSMTPKRDEIIRRIDSAVSLGADIIKIAYMPVNENDVDLIIETGDKALQITDKPLICISMGSSGKRSRIMGIRRGDAIIYSKAARESAPGQLSISEALVFRDSL